MTVIDKLATSLKRRDEVPNQELAKAIIKNNDQAAVMELMENLSNKSKDIQHDCIKVIYEIGEVKPEMISGYIADFVKLLDSKNNRMQWGAMSALNRVASYKPEVIYANLAKLADAAEKGTVITKDNFVAILIKLSSLKEYKESALTLLHEEILRSLPNQLPMYAENALPVIPKSMSNLFMETLRMRMADIEKDSKRTRVEKVIQKLGKM
jgi:hypothetical protein